MPSKSFEFGRNWDRFLKKALTPKREAEAQQSLQDFTGLTDLKGKTFLDIGCGSGLFSLAAHRMGAAKVVSFDVDPFSVRCCRYLHAREGSPTNWTVTEGSILDADFVRGLGTFDVVYSWGVLHHTGNMRLALEHAASMVKPQSGMLYIAIYNTSDIRGRHADGRFGTSKFWEQEKKFYTSLPRPLQRGVDYGAMTTMTFLYLLTLQNPLRKMREHSEQFRGMDWATDIRDWLGGYPYEHARTHEIFTFFKERGFELENLRTVNDLRNNEFLFKRKN